MLGKFRHRLVVVEVTFGSLSLKVGPYTNVTEGILTLTISPLL